MTLPWPPIPTRRICAYRPSSFSMALRLERLIAVRFGAQPKPLDLRLLAQLLCRRDLDVAFGQSVHERVGHVDVGLGWGSLDSVHLGEELAEEGLDLEAG